MKMSGGGQTAGDEDFRERPAGIARGGGRILRIDVGVEQPIGRHRNGSCRDHAENDQFQLAKLQPAGSSAGGEHRCQNCPWEGEDAVMQFDIGCESRNFVQTELVREGGWNGCVTQ